LGIEQRCVPGLDEVGGQRRLVHRHAHFGGPLSGELGRIGSIVTVAETDRDAVGGVLRGDPASLTFVRVRPVRLVHDCPLTAR
jgi:hypothetical protein